jgi:hypothetical protein
MQPANHVSAEKASVDAKDAHNLLGLALLLMIASDSQGRTKRSEPQAQPQQTQKTPAPDQRGTEQSPLIIKQIPTETSETERAQKAKADEEKAELDRKLVKYNGDLAYYTKVLAVLAAFQFAALIVQAIVFGFTLSANRKAANAALRQANAMIALERPILATQDIKLVGFPDAINPQSNEDPAEGQNIPAICRALVGTMSIGRTYARITQFCLEWTISRALPSKPQYLPAHNERTNTYFMPIAGLVNYFGLGHPANPITLTTADRQRLANGETFWVYGFVTYESFADEVFELGFIARWAPGQGLIAEPNQAYAYSRKSSP